MKIVFEKNTLTDAVTGAMSAISGKKDLPALECIRIKTEEQGCRISSFDGEKGFETVIPCNTFREGACLVNASKFLTVIRMMPGDIEFDIYAEGKARISSGSSVFEMQTLPAENFPMTPALMGDHSFVISQGILKSMVNRTIFAVAENNTRIQLNGAYFVISRDMLKIVALDGLRFAQRVSRGVVKNVSEKEGELDLAFIVPKKALTEAMRFLNDSDDPITIIKARKHVLFCIENVIFYIRQIDGAYIDYDRFMPRNQPTEAIISPAAVKDALERALIVTEDREIGKLKAHVSLKFLDGVTEITAKSSQNRVFEQITTEKTGPDVDIAFNCKLICECFRVIEGDRTKVSLSTPLSAILMEPEDECDDSYCYYVFPTRVQEDF